MDHKERLVQIEEKVSAIYALLQKAEPGQSDAMLNTEEASTYLGISISTLYKHTSAGKIPYYKPKCKLILFQKNDLYKWVGAKRISSNKEIKDHL